MITGTKIFGNQATGEGGGVYHTGSGKWSPGQLGLGAQPGRAAKFRGRAHSTGQVDVLHVTIADSALNSGSAVVVSIGTVNIVNTIIASHTVGIDGMGGMINEDYNLFYGNSTPQTGTINHGGHSFSGDPAFVNPDADDYHITRWSAALNTGTPVGVFADMDNQPRPVGSGFDIGADEAQLIWGPVGPSLGWMLNYTNTLAQTPNSRFHPVRRQEPSSLA